MLNNPDALAAALRREAERFPAHAEAVAEELRRVEKLPRPESRPEEPETRVDPREDYLRALQRERARSGEARHADIDAEIARVKAEIRSASVSRAVEASDTEQTTTEPARRGRPRKTTDDTEE